MNKSDKYNQESIAIIGIAMQVPGAGSLEELWGVITEGKECISDLPLARKRDIEAYRDYSAGYDHELRYNKGGFLQNIDQFDNSHFRISPKESSVMDPTHRMFLESCWEAIEDAGYAVQRLAGTDTGVYAGVRLNHSAYATIAKEVDPEGYGNFLTGNATAIVANRVSYLLNLTGPSMTLDTACSSSLVGLHLACQAIRSGDCSMALVGGAYIMPDPIQSDVKIGIESEFNKTKTFDASADGTVESEGVITLLLKSYNQAKEDRDHIYALIRGSAVNQDGKTIGLTSPSAEAQGNVIRKAWKNADIDPETITYIEAHGTGTKIGDPIEVLGIRKAFEAYTSKKQFCAIGSVKTNLGHLNCVSGLAGLIKVILAMQYKVIPKQINFLQPNKRIRFIDSPLYVSDRNEPWNAVPRRSGISSFGIGGTNCHIVVEEEPSVPPREEELPDVLCLSAKSRKSLIELMKQYEQHLRTHLDLLNIQDLCFTANNGRTHYKHRLSMLIKSKEDLLSKLEQLNCMDDSLWIQEPDIYIGGEEAFTQQALSCSEEAPLPLQTIAQRYAAGMTIDFSALYRGQSRHRVRIPVTPFERKRCWIQIPEHSRVGKCFEMQDGYEVVWKEDLSPNRPAAARNDVVTIVLGGGGERERAILASLQADTENVIPVTITDYCAKEGERFFITGDRTGYQWLFRQIGISGKVQLVHMTSVGSVNAADDYMELGTSMIDPVINLLTLIRTFQMNQIQEAELVIVTRYAYLVNQTDLVQPVNAALHGFAKSFHWEFPQVGCKCIDIDDATELSVITREVLCQSPYFITALRAGRRYYEELNPMSETTVHAELRNVGIKENGLYLITGGFGGIGLELAKYLSGKKKVRLILLGRSRLPDTDARKMDMIKQMENSGSTIIHYAADIADFDRMKQIMEEIRVIHGPLNGIVHCAGNGMVKEIHELSEDSLRGILRPKVQGTWILDRLTCNEPPDFICLFSSAMTLIGGYGAAGYTAANSYMNSYASMRCSASTPFINIRWPEWTDTGLAECKQTNLRKELFEPLLLERAIRYFDWVLHHNVHDLIPGRINWGCELYEISEQLPIRFSESVNEEFHKRQQLRPDADSRIQVNNKTATRTIEQKIGSLIGELLSYEHVDYNQNFFELGVDSIIAAKIINRIQNQLNCSLEVADIFRYPTVHQLSGHLETLWQQLSMLKAIVPAKEQKYYPVSAAQKRIFLLQSISRNNTAYNMLDAFRIDGDLDRQRLEKAFLSLIHRHETLRTYFLVEGAEVVQKVSSECSFRLEWADLSQDTSMEVEACIRPFISCFNLGTSPLIRAKLIKLQQNEHLLLIDIHHIVTDGTSRGIILGELGDGYEGRTLPPLELQYKDYSTWQSEMQKEGYFKRQTEYWLRRYQTLAPPLELPTDYVRTSYVGFEGRMFSIEVDRKTTDRLRSFAAEKECTLYMVLLSVYYVLLNKFSGQEDIVVGFPIEGRTQMGTEKIIGLFVNTLALRNYPVPCKSFLDFLFEVKTSLLEAYDNQELPFDELVNALGIQRDTNRNPLYDTLFVLQNSTKIQGQFQDVRLVPYSIDQTASKMDLEVEVTETSAQARINFTYKTALYKEETIRSIADEYNKLIELTLNDPSMDIGSLTSRAVEQKPLADSWDFNFELELD